MVDSLSARINIALKERDQRIALVAGKEKVSGKDLRERALDLAATLRASGVQAADTVGILVDRSIDSVVGMLAVLNLQCSYLPLDATSPEKWLSHLLAVARARLLLFPQKHSAIATHLGDLLPSGVMALDAQRGVSHLLSELINEEVDNSCFAYVMGTSGTTGKPKAVPIKVSSLLHYCDTFAAAVGGPAVLANMRMASLSTLAADLGNTMVFPSLLFGGELHLMPLEVLRDPWQFENYIQEHRIDAIKVVPTHLRALLDHGAGVLPHRLLVVGGEPFGLDLLTRLEACTPMCEVYNHYGPTEATIGVAMYKVSTVPGSAALLRSRGHQTVPIGVALGDNELRVVNEQLDSCVEMQVGELAVSGPSVSDGYLGDPESSSWRYTQGNWPSHFPIYRTGDLACMYATGEFELFGRADRQFKIRGHRVEAAGVEEAIRVHPRVIDAFVDCYKDEEFGGALVAWVHAENVDDIALRAFLASRLPEPMVPSRIVIMGSFPRTANGKVDSSSLPSPKGKLPLNDPRSVQEAVNHVFSEVLALPLEAINNNFFRLGGHSLTALRAIGLLRENHNLEVTVADFYSDASPSAIARVARPAPPVMTTEVSAPPTLQLTDQVRALWTHLRLNQFDTTYEVPVRLRVLGVVTLERIRLALSEFVARHQALRTRFIEIDGQPVAVVDDNGNATFKIFDSNTLADPHMGGLDIESGPLISCTLTQIRSHECLIDLLIHHISYDGTSGATLVRELATMLNGERLLPVQDFRGETPVFRNQAPVPIGDGARARFGLPPSQSLHDGSSRCHELTLAADLWNRVETCATTLNTTVFVIAAAAWALVLSRQDNESAIALGTPADLRNPSTEGCLVGYHSNVIIIEIEILPDDTVENLIGRTHNAVGRAIQDRYRPYAIRVSDQRAATGTPPTRTLLTVERLEQFQCGGIEIRQETVPVPRPIFDVDATLVVGETVTLQIHHRVAVCPEGRARCLGEQFIHVLGQFAGNRKAISGDIEILPNGWVDRIMEWSCGPTANLAKKLVTPSILTLALKEPDAAAVVWPEGKWSRSQFVKAVRRTAQTLRDRGLGPGHAIAVVIAPSPALACAWHAAHEVGVAVLALDPTWPQVRRVAAIQRAQADVQITSPDGLLLEFSGSARLNAPHASDLAYIIPTSGSTGVPKLVAVQHSALRNELSWSAGEFQINCNDRVLAHSSPGFDVTAWELLCPLSCGACLVFPALNRRGDITYLAELICDQKITVIQAVPSLLESLIDQLPFAPSELRLLISGGEEMPMTLPSAIAQRLPWTKLVNTYGPAETAIDVVFCWVGASLPSCGRVPLGRPISGTMIYVVDDRLRLLPPGAFGQIAIAGNAVGRGYLGDPAETDRRFVSNPFVSGQGQKMFLSGDRARWNDDGLLEFGGRLDHQVKVRGNRVELEEIEATLLSLPTVQDAVVQLQNNGTVRARLMAFVVPRKMAKLTVHDLHNHCAQLLPSYMTPNVFRLLESLPRLSNGKLARNALLVDPLDVQESSNSWHSEMEREVAKVWTEVLGHRIVERDFPFLACGGTSLLVPILQLHLKETLGLDLSVPELFEHATIWAQARILEQRKAGMGVEGSAMKGRGTKRSEAYETRWGTRR